MSVRPQAILAGCVALAALVGGLEWTGRADRAARTAIPASLPASGWPGDGFAVGLRTSVQHPPIRYGLIATPRAPRAALVILADSRRPLEHWIAPANALAADGLSLAIIETGSGGPSGWLRPLISGPALPPTARTDAQIAALIGELALTPPGVPLVILGEGNQIGRARRLAPKLSANRVLGLERLPARISQAAAPWNRTVPHRAAPAGLQWATRPEARLAADPVPPYIQLERVDDLGSLTADTLSALNK